MCGRRHTTGKAMVTENFDELNGCRVVRAIQSNVDVAHDVDWVDERGDAIEHVGKLVEECRCLVHEQ